MSSNGTNHVPFGDISGGNNAVNNSRLTRL